MNIKYLKGDATNPIGNDNKIICHVCNNIGAWGAGFVMAISRKWKTPEKAYRTWYQTDNPHFGLGHIQLVRVKEDIIVCNMVAQQGVGMKDGKPPIRYESLEKCFDRLLERIEPHKNISLHMPRIGCGLAGGKWKDIESILQKTIGKTQIPIYVYDL